VTAAGQAASDDEVNGGSWKLVGSVQPRVTRRRSTSDRHDVHSALTEGLTSDGLSPVAEVPGSPVQSVEGSIRRSRTLPSKRGTVESRSGEGEARPSTASSPGQPEPAPEEPPRRVLRKQKRSSMQPVQRQSQI